MAAEWSMGKRSMHDVALIYQPLVPTALPLARACAEMIGRRGFGTSIISSWNVSHNDLEPSLRLVVTFGGDGTILRAARWLAGTRVPVVGVQMGRLGFLAEVMPAQMPDALAPYLDGEYWLDERSMLQAAIIDTDGSYVHVGGALSPSVSGERVVEPQDPQTYVALNDIVVGRGQSLRTVTVDLSTEGHLLHSFRCDGLIVATATGSTAYSFAAGGPILAPASTEVAVTAICPHISALRSLVLPGDSPFRLKVWTSEPAVVTIDGQTDRILTNGQAVETRLSAQTAVFARGGTRAEYYSRILAKLE